MNLGLRSIMLIVAIVLFLLGAFTDSDVLIPVGLAAFAAAFLLGDRGPR
ncbi:MAG TPA: hypothetical protein VM840_01095 [Actinomycetota bacterium]|nr:hypothetical protein [Actinomycetota bacterium]